jgi:hypothetical protein
MEDFTTLAYLLTFPGMIAAVILLTQFTKKMFDSLLPNQTKYVVYFFSLWLCIAAAAFNGTFVNVGSIFETVIVWFINSIIVWFAAMKTFELAMGKNKDAGTLQIDSSNPDKDVYRFEFDVPLEDLRTKKSVTLKVDNHVDLSQE